ncbi:MAG: glycosyltransferase family 2 protein [Candidatus Tectomicrobia bacterium]|nr:glycosyltransferase family 2 protein [Candidatus Tectomicrobia bacterium]
MHEDPTVSVIIPAYDVAVSLGRCLDSVFLQDINALQVIVINDGSTDDTPEVAKSYGDRILYFEQENQGQGAARNTGLRAARGDYIAFLDADDYWQPGFLKACVDFLQHQPEAIAVSTGQIIKLWGHADRINPPVLVEPSARSEWKPCLLDDFFSFWAEQDHIRTGSAVIRKWVIDQAGYQRADLRISQDLEYWGYLATYGKWGFIPELLWVGDPIGAAKAKGWQNKYRSRRRLCPTVEHWQERIVLRLAHKDWAHFRKVRGRVAASFALNKALAGDDEGSRDIVAKYGSDMSRTRYTRLMHAGNWAGWYGWKLICHLLRLREWIKALLIRSPV